MPRITQESEKSRWLAAFESGKSERHIAREARCDVRTVKRAIQELRLAQDAKLARVELVKEALRRHQDSLLQELDGIIDSLRLPDQESVKVNWYDWEKVNPSLAATEAELPQNKKKKLPRAPGSMLTEHLRNDRLWKVVKRWKDASEEHEAARLAFQKRTAELLEQNTGLKLLTKPEKPPFLYAYNAGEVVYKWSLQQAFKKEGSLDDESRVVTDGERGQVRYSGMVLAEAPGREEEIRAAIIGTIRELAGSPEAARVVATYETAKIAAAAARQTAEQVKALGMIPGLCDICRRLGLR